MTYIINEKENIVVLDDGNLGKSFYGDDWRNCTNQEIENHKISELKTKKLPSRHSYLDSTDWYIIRKIERGVDIPENITEDRLKAIKEIDNITLLNSVDELEKISNNFEKTEV